MSDSNSALAIRLVGLALIGVGLIGLVEATAVTLLARSLQVGWAVLLVPAGFGLLRGNARWVLPLMRVMQGWAIAATTIVVLAAFAPSIPFLAEGVEVAGWGRAVVVATAVAEAALWVWVLGLGRRLAALQIEDVA